jgi:general secretion pathway protein L
MLVDGEGQTRTPVQTGAPAVAVIGGARRVVVLVPGEDVALHAARVPVGRNRQRLLRAIPFALEEQLASDIEDLHFAIGKPDGDQYPVAVVERRQMDAWAKLLREAGISAHQWVPETLAVPHAGDGWDLLPDGERVLVRSGDCSGFTCDADTLEVMTTLVAAEERLPAHGTRPRCSRWIFSRGAGRGGR